MNRLFFSDSLTTLILVTDVARYVITLEHDFCPECSDVLNDYDFTQLNFWEIVEGEDSPIVEMSETINGHGITIRER